MVSAWKEPISRETQCHQGLTFRRAVISLAVMDDKEADKEAKDDREMAETEKEEDKGSAVDGGKEEEDDIGSPFQWMDTVYV